MMLAIRLCVKLKVCGNGYQQFIKMCETRPDLANMISEIQTFFSAAHSAMLIA